MKEEIKNYSRQDLFDYYHERSNPFVIVTTKIDITKIYNYCKLHKYHYATIAYEWDRRIQISLWKWQNI